jgi:hypothetical protein
MTPNERVIMNNEWSSWRKEAVIIYVKVFSRHSLEGRRAPKLAIHQN